MDTHDNGSEGASPEPRKRLRDPDLKTKTDDDLVQLAQSGNVEATTVLVERWIPIVEKSARKLSAGNFDDLKQSGSVALLRAIRSFDFNATDNSDFKRYALTCINNASRACFHDQLSMIKHPAPTLALLRALEREVQRLSIELNRQPTESEIAAYTKKDPALLKELRRQRSIIEVYSLDDLQETGDIDVEAICAEDVDKNEPEARARQLEVQKFIRRLLESLPPEQSSVVKLRFGLQGQKEMTLDEIGSFTGRSRQAVCQLLNRIYAHIRAQLSASDNPS